MKSIKSYLVALSILALALFPLPTSGQTQDYPPEFSPLRTSRPRREQRSLIPPTKFVKVQNSIPNRYIVVLNDDVVASDAALDVRRARIAAIAISHAQAHFGRVGFIYETALKGYSIELPNEAAAIAISQNPKVKWVEEVERLQLLQEDPEEPDAFQTNPPWGLDAIDGSVPVGPVLANGTTNGLYLYNRTGAGVNVYVLDTGIRRTHQDFNIPPFFPPPGRAFIARDFIAGSGFLDSCISPKPNANDNDCAGHGTHVAGTIGGRTYGAAKEVTILSVKVCTANFNGCPADVVNAGINWVTSEHNANPSVPAVANMSLGGDGLTFGFVFDAAVTNSIAAGVTYVVAAGNSNDDARFFTPADVAAALTVGAMDAGDSRALTFPFGGGSNFGSVDLFAPGYGVLSANAGSDTDSTIAWGTSFASPHAAGAVALYLQGRPSMSNCSAFPIQGRSSQLGGAISTCPDRVVRFMDSNANLNKLINVNGTDRFGTPVTSPNRLILTGYLLAPLNPVDNQRFFVWQHYADFLVNQPEPDENGLNFWTGNITNTCGTGINDNNGCTSGKRIDVSRAFWAAQYPSAFQNNAQFVQLCYQVYLRRTVPTSDSGYQFWLGDLNSYGVPASQAGHNHLIDAFLSSGEYRQRFGQP